MSVDLYVLSDRRLVSVAAWQQAIDGERSELVLPADTSIDKLDGFLPVRWNGTLRASNACTFPRAK